MIMFTKSSHLLKGDGDDYDDDGGDGGDADDNASADNEDEDNVVATAAANDR
ncbi:hypothetical protein DPMN_142151 [Dreissena polymorpha]|uniref:Uncharacterized protein n=1 Tax=Dreissena polymorpha TaxID=45954 RepID=A0A9D4GAR9_DREPO|nr:hypothetical protein DPMN_142151 [Dreissena polymorpha]